MKRTGLLLFAMILVLAGCHKRYRVTALPPAAPEVAPVIPEVVPEVPRPPQPEPVVPPVVFDPLEAPDRAYDAGNYADARAGYQDYLDKQPEGDRRDHALFRVAMTYALASGNSPDWAKVTSFLKQLVDEYPASSLRSPSLVILSLQNEMSQLNGDNQRLNQKVKQLTNEIDKMKQIDADRRKRP